MYESIPIQASTLFLNIQIYQDLDRYVFNLFIFFILVMNNTLISLEKEKLQR